MAHTIIRKSYANVFMEYEAAAAITPGMLVELTSAGTVQKHSGAGKTAFPMYAIEDALQGKGITEAYAAGDKVRVWIPNPGDIVYARLADGQNVVIGNFLESAGNGELRKRVEESWESADAQAANTVYDKSTVGVAIEAQDLSALEGSESSAAGNSQYIDVLIF